MSLAFLGGQQELVAVGAKFVLTFKIPVLGADGERRRYGDVGQPESLQGSAHEFFAGAAV